MKLIKIGTTSFGFRYSFLDPDHSPPLTAVLQQARQAGAERFQVCENTRPLELSRAQWQSVLRCASDLGMELQLGCKTLQPAVVERYMDLASWMSCDLLRVVMEELDAHATPEAVLRLFDAVVPKMQSAGMRLAVENHFDISSTRLLELVERYPRDVVGFCIDTANSLRSFEQSLDVLRLLQPRAICYHLKDYRVTGTMVSFAVEGAPLGEGQLDLDGCLKMILAKEACPQLHLETWTPSCGQRERDIATEADWLNRSVQALRARLP
jgi:sugar phosphate isomerase/epimerase